MATLGPTTATGSTAHQVSECEKGNVTARLRTVLTEAPNPTAAGRGE
jgi:hypothetical protein